MTLLKGLFLFCILLGFTALSKDFSTLLEKLKGMPEKPGDPGPAGANEFFSADWLTGIVFPIEVNATLAGWKEATAKAPGIVGNLKAALKKLVEEFHVWEVKP